MGFSETVQWWEDWQLQFLVLTSLFLQYFLFVAARLRKCRISHLFRSLIWLAYQGCDAVAIYALATLFNHHKKEEMAAHPGSAHLDTLWAPILLLHLGGQDGITAYSIEDNENWRRHLLISVSQITVAIYVFSKSWWTDDRRLLRAGILLFVPGILKCLEKPWALKNATFTSIRDSHDSQLEKTLEGSAQHKDIRSPNKYVHEAEQIFGNLSKQPLAENWKDKMADEPYHLFADLAHPYFIRLKNLQLMALPDAREGAHGLVRSSLSRAFDRLYTKQRRGSFFVALLRAAVVLLPFVDIGLFHKSRQSAYDGADVVVTYVLLCCTAALELVSACLLLGSGSGLPLLDDRIPQYNLVAYLARQNNYQWFWSLVSRLGCKDRLERLLCTAPSEPSIGITKLVYDHVAKGWTKYMHEPTWEIVTTGAGDKEWYSTEVIFVGQYRRFNDSRGQRTLKWVTESESESATDSIADLDSAVSASMRIPFDESVLLWHLATELCYFEHVDTGSDATRHSRIISDYMAYLLFVNPDMLAPGTRRDLFKAAYHDLEPSGCHVELEPAEPTLVSPPKTKDDMARKIIQMVKGTLGSDDLVHKAWEIADELMEFAKRETEKAEKAEEEKEGKEKKKREDEGEGMDRLTVEQHMKALEVKKKALQVKKKQLLIRAKKVGDDKMWALIQGVWVEMLCFSAGRCRGYLHAKNLGKGGEYLSYVWLLLSYMGMETMPERTQRPELPVEGDMGALAKPLPEEMVKEPAKDNGNQQGNMDRGNKRNKPGEPEKKNEAGEPEKKNEAGEPEKKNEAGEPEKNEAGLPHANATTTPQATGTAAPQATATTAAATLTAEVPDITTTTLTAAVAPIVGDDNV